MYGNNLGAPFMMPNPYMQMPNINPMMTRGINNIGAMGGLSRGASMSKAGGLLSGIKGLNWSGMLNNVSKTLGVVKEAIPVVKEVRPMMHNMRSMLKIASVFNDETTTSNTQNNKVKENTNKPENSKKKKLMKWIYKFKQVMRLAVSDIKSKCYIKCYKIIT